MSSTNDRGPDGTARDQGHGLFVNLFDAIRDPLDHKYVGIELVTQAAAGTLLTAARRSELAGTYRPIWVEKDPAIPGMYHLDALAKTLALGSPGTGNGQLVVYVPLPFMKTGRVRAAVSALAERLTGPSFPNTLGIYAAGALEAPDEALPESAALTGGDLAGIRERFADDPEAAADAVFGEWTSLREGSEDLEMLMRESSARLTALEKDPDSADDSEASEAENVTLEDVADGGRPMPLRPGEDDADSESGEAPAKDQAAERKYEDDVADYVIAHARVHVSPVIARGIAAYRQQGASAAAQELKVTKAPRKTLGALGSFATYGFDGVAVLFDQFDGWERIGQDVRLSIASSVMEMRWALNGSGVVAIMSSQGVAPELEEQFAAAERVDWDMAGLDDLGKEGAPISAVPLGRWLPMLSLGEPTVSADDPVFALIEERSEGDLERFVELAKPVVREAVVHRADRLDAAALDVAMQVASAGAEASDGEEGSA